MHSETIECLEGMNKNAKHWLGWKRISEDFTSINTLKKILPKNRENFADEIAQFLFDFAEEIKPDIDKMNKMRIN